MSQSAWMLRAQILLVELTFGKGVRCLEAVCGQSRDRAIEKLKAELVAHDTSNIDDSERFLSQDETALSAPRFATHILRFSTPVYAN